MAAIPESGPAGHKPKPSDPPSARVPTVILRADACPHGLGGYSLTSGQAWRFEIPPQYCGGLSLNLLEYLASLRDHNHSGSRGKPDPTRSLSTFPDGQLHG